MQHNQRQEWQQEVNYREHSRQQEVPRQKIITLSLLCTAHSCHVFTKSKEAKKNSSFSLFWSWNHPSFKTGPSVQCSNRVVSVDKGEELLYSLLDPFGPNFMITKLVLRWFSHTNQVSPLCTLFVHSSLSASLWASAKTHPRTFIE